MGIFKRVGDIISANINELIDEFEDPEKMLRAAVREMETAIRTAMDTAAKVIGAEKLLTKQLAEHRRHVETCQQAAKDAVARGDDDAARTALTRKTEHEKLMAALTDQLSATQSAANKLRRQIEAMQVRLAEARRKQVTLTARKQVAESTWKLAADLGSTSVDTGAFSRFDSLCQRVEQAEAEAEALLELSGCVESIPTVALDVEAELQELKRNAAH